MPITEQPLCARRLPHTPNPPGLPLINQMEGKLSLPPTSPDCFPYLYSRLLLAICWERLEAKSRNTVSLSSFLLSSAKSSSSNTQHSLALTQLPPPSSTTHAAAAAVGGGCSDQHRIAPPLLWRTKPKALPFPLILGVYTFVGCPPLEPTYTCDLLLMNRMWQK